MNCAERKLVSAVMTRDVCQLGIERTAHDVLTLMQAHSVSSVLIVEQEMILGVITERDIVLALERKGELHALGCADLMQSPVITVNADTPCLDAYRLMTSRAIRHLAVTDKHGHVCGIASEGDVMRHFGIEYYMNFKDVGSVMSTDFCRLAPAAPVAEALARMVDRRQSCVVVVDERDRPLGMLTERDVVRLWAERDHPDLLLLEQAMHAPVLTVKPRKRLHAAVKVMEDAHVRRLVVVDDRGAACGLLTHHEIARGLEGDYATHLKEIVELQARSRQTADHAINEKLLLSNVLRSASETALLASDLDYRISYATQAVAPVLGLRVEAVGGADLRETLQRIGWQEASLSLREQVVTAGARHYVVPTHRGHTDFQVSLLLNEQDQPQGYLVLAQKI